MLMDEFAFDVQSLVQNPIFRDNAVVSILENRNLIELKIEIGVIFK